MSAAASCPCPRDMKERLCDMMSFHRCNHSRTQTLINKSSVMSVSAHREGEKKERVEKKINDERREVEGEKEQRRDGGLEVSVTQEAMKKKKKTVL